MHFLKRQMDQRFLRPFAYITFAFQSFLELPILGYSRIHTSVIQTQLSFTKNVGDPPSPILLMPVARRRQNPAAAAEIGSHNSAFFAGNWQIGRHEHRADNFPNEGTENPLDLIEEEQQ
jgi:hypothetical protein